MKIALTLDGLVSSDYLYRDTIDDDLFCLNQMANENAWYAVNRWFSQGHDVFLLSSRSNKEFSLRWLDEWAFAYNRLICDIPFGYHYNACIALDCAIFVTSSTAEIPKDSSEVRTYLLGQPIANKALPVGAWKINDLNDIDLVIQSWPHHPKKSGAIIAGQSRTLRTS